MKAAFCWIFGLSLLVGGGCGGSGSGGSASGARLALEEVGEVYRIYILTKHKPPAKFADLARMKDAGPTGFGALRSGAVVVRYGAMMPDTEDGPAKSPSDEVLAYEKQVPESGGDVLLLDRTVRTMTADEFKAAKKAGKG